MDSTVSWLSSLPALPPAVGWGALVLSLLSMGIALVSALSALRCRNAVQRFVGRALTHATSPESLLASLLAHAESANQKLTALEETTRHLKAHSRLALQYWHLVRFNPFQGEGVGGKQSFSLALLDGTRSGVIITAIHGRDRTRLYAKTVVQGKPSGALSTEEEEALTGALQHASSLSAKASTPPPEEPAPERQAVHTRTPHKKVAPNQKRG